MNILRTITLALFLLGCFSSFSQETVKAKDSKGYTYQYVTNDPYNVRIYTLENGLTVYLSQNKQTPRIQTYIAVKAGSTYDPKENTGLAHYLEHMMFKGTSKLGTINWDAEKPLLDTIEALYEKHKAATSKEEKQKIYKQIDSVSLVASKYAIANEYDKLTSLMGASGTNAYTSFEETVYINNIPSNELSRFMAVESERFSNLSLRLFHTELEAVYEEFNMSQDNDFRKAYYALFNGLFSEHPYGTQTTIGTAEHLKNPSIKNIKNYWNKYYVPNNIALCLSGDLEFEETIAIIDKTWGKIKSQSVAPLNLPKEKEITKPIEKEVFGPSAEFLMLGYRSGGVKHEDSKYLFLVDYILSSGGKAGLIDLNLVKTQKVLRAGCDASFLNDYGYQWMYGMPRQGQSLDEVKQLLLSQIEKIKKGDFEDWQLSAAVNDQKLSEIKSQESNKIASSFVHSFVHNIMWEDHLKYNDELAKITKEELVAFANRFYKDNYVAVYKRSGQDTSVIKVDKPEITPVPINREASSEYFNQQTSQKPESIKPEFIDFSEKLYHKEFTNGKDFYYVKNNTNELFSLYYIVEIGEKHNKLLPLAVSYLNYLGTEKHSTSDISKFFYRKGLEYGVSAGEDRCYIYIKGLDGSFEEGLEMINHLISEAKADTTVYQQMVYDIMQSRANAKQDKSTILWKAMVKYALYKEDSPFKDIYTEEELANINPNELAEAIHSLLNYPHSIFYYGKRDAKTIIKNLKKANKEKVSLLIPEAKETTPLATDSSIVYFVNYDMVQAEILMLSRGEKFDIKKLPFKNMYNQYFGSGLSSIVFQELRESKALAYRASAAYQSSGEVGKHDFVYSYIGTNADKVDDAITAMNELTNKMPKATQQFEQARQNYLQKIETQRILKSGIFFKYLAYKEMGVDYDIRKDLYEKVNSLTIDELETFFNQNIANRKYVYLILGNKNDIDFSVLKKLGKVEELTLEQIFGY